MREVRQDTLLDVLIELAEDGRYDPHTGRNEGLMEDIAERFSALDIVISKTVERIIAADESGTLYGENSGWWLTGYVKNRPSDLGEARAKLAEHFRVARDRDLDEQAKSNLEGAKSAEEDLSKEQQKTFNLGREKDELERQLRHLRPALANLLGASEKVKNYDLSMVVSNVHHSVQLATPIQS